MRFLCICLSPAIDATVGMNAWPTDGCIIKNATDVFLPGGKGLNVARWLSVRGASVSCGGLLGEDNAVMFEKELAKYGIEDRFVRVPGATRVNEMFVTPQGSFKVNRAASGGPVRTWAELVASGRGRPGYVADASRVGEFDVVILSGSLPKDWPVDTYRSLIAAAKAAGATTVLDASGKALVEGVKAHPDVIKPNADECEALIGFVPKTPDDFRRATAALKAFCDFPIVSDGGSGCWFDGEFVPAPRVDVLDTTAAGDTLLAEWCWRRFAGSGGLEVGRWSVAAGSAACTRPGGEPPDPALVESLVLGED